MFDVTVTEHPTVTAGGSENVYTGSVGRLEGTITNFDADATLMWTHDGAQSLGITIADDTAPSTTFEVTGDVASDTTVTFTLAVSDVILSTVTASTDVKILDSSGAFITTWELTESKKAVSIDVAASSEAQYVIDWGDGTQSDHDSFQGPLKSHQYDEAGTYRIVIDGDVGRVYHDDYTTANLLKSIDQWGGIKWTSMQDAFRGASGMTYVATDAPDLSRVTDMSHMFNGATLFDGDISEWDVSHVTNMGFMFFDASSFNQPLDSWNVSHVTNMRFMFSDASSFNQPLDSWDVSHVTNMKFMFFDATSFDRNLGEWYVIPADTAYDVSEGTLNVTTISAQNSQLDGHTPNYGIGDDSPLFNMTGSTLSFKSAPTSNGIYPANVTASGEDVFANGNNWHLLEIEVTGQMTDTTDPVHNHRRRQPCSRNRECHVHRCWGHLYGRSRRNQDGDH